MSRSRFRSFQTAVVTSGLTAAFASLALAQEPAPAPVGTEPLVPTVVDPTPPPPPPAVIVETPAPEAPATAPMDVAPPIAQKEQEPRPEAPAQTEAHWYDSLTFGAFVDAYGAIRSDNNTRPNFQGIPSGGYYHEAYVQGDGFALAFAGLDVSYNTEKFGATVSMRFGPGVNRFYAADTGLLGIDNITQAFATYRPTDRLTFDLGQFGTIYGAEVLESWKNLNYSRGALYYAMQPFWHTGLRANIRIVDELSFNVLVVNGVNNVFENNKSPSLGLQALITPHESLTVALGYLGALNPRDDGNGAFQNFYDAVATYSMGDFRLVANADLNTYRNVGSDKVNNWWGVSIAPGYQFNEYIGAALRYEYLSDGANLWLMTKNKVPVDAEMPDNGAVLASKSKLSTITATLDIKPVPGSKGLILRPEFRYEIAGDNYFYDKSNNLSDKFWVAVLGVVVATNP